MQKTLITLILLTVINLSAVDFDYKEIKEFQTLEHFKSVEAFEKSYQGYVQRCLDNTNGGTAGIPCFIGYKMWDRELNIYYKRLKNHLPEKMRRALRNSEIKWIKSRNVSETFVSDLLADAYKDSEGTMYQLMSAGENTNISTLAVKARALQLKAMYELISK